MFFIFLFGYKEISFLNKNIILKKNIKICYNFIMRINYEINICNLNWVKSN